MQQKEAVSAAVSTVQGSRRWRSCALQPLTMQLPLPAGGDHNAATQKPSRGTAALWKEVIYILHIKYLYIKV